jgi:Fur family ferric uptake transcriptional regulator
VEPYDWTDHALAALKGADRRAGVAREAVVRLLGQQECCVSAHEIHDGLRNDGIRVGIASVYRALDVLSSLGLVRRVDVGSATARYEPLLPGGEHHHHLVCDGCGRVDSFSDDKLEHAIDRLAARIGYAVDRHDVVLRGTCEACFPG